MSVFGLSSSPRKNGNTDYAVQYTLDRIQDTLACDTTFRRVCDVNIKPCLGCRYCMKENECVMTDDDFYPIWHAIQEAKLWIIGAPVYWYGPPGPMKNFMDRAHAWFACPHKVPENRFVGLISVAADSGFSTHEQCILSLTNYYGMHTADTVRLLAREKNDLQNNSNQMEKLLRFIHRMQAVVQSDQN